MATRAFHPQPKMSGPTNSESQNTKKDEIDENEIEFGPNEGGDRNVLVQHDELQMSSKFY
jgi:hypothetical protein